MEKYYNVFISSTSKDLDEYRKEVIESVRDVRGIVPINMENFGASRDNALQKCYGELQRADVFVGFYAYRYGFAPGPEMTYETAEGTRAGDGKTGITDWEYQWAEERGIPLLLYAIEKDVPWNPELIDKPDTDISAFKGKIGVKHVMRFFTSREELARFVAVDLGNTRNDIEREQMQPKSAEQVKAAEDHAITAAASERQAEKQRPKSTSRFINPLPRRFRARGKTFYDRIHEQERVRKGIERGVPLITVFGKAGVGKTGLACYVLEGIENDTGAIRGMVYRSMENGVVSLDDIINDFKKLGDFDIPAGVPDAVRISHLLDALRQEGRYLLLLDNFETVQDTEQNIITDPATKTLIDCVLQQGGLTVLVTTRYPLPLDTLQRADERAIPLEEGLPPDYALKFLRGNDSNDYLPQDDAQLHDLINLTNGFPRALEAAIGWLNEKQGKGKLAELLQGGDGKEKIIEQIVNKAIDVLPPSLRQVLDALAICHEAASLPMLEYLLAPFRDQDAFPLHEAVDRLVKSHFVIESQGHYGMHPLDREFCLDNLADADDVPVRTPRESSLPFTKHVLNTRAIDFYKNTRKDQDDWHTLEDLHPVLMEFEHRLAMGDYDTATRVLLTIDFDYLLRWGYVSRMRDLHLRLEPDKVRDNWLRGAHLGNLGLAYADLGEIRTAIDYYERALKIDIEIENKRGEGIRLGNLGIAYSDLGEIRTAIDYYERALKIAEETEDKRGEGIRRGNLGFTQVIDGQQRQGIDNLRRAVELAREIESPREINYSGTDLAEAHILNDDLAAAKTAIEEACSQDVDENNHHAAAVQGVVLLRLGDKDAAKAAFERSVVHADDILGKTPGLYEALYARGLARAGLALLGAGELRTAEADYTAAMVICKEKGVLDEAARLLGYLRGADANGVLDSLWKSVN